MHAAHAIILRHLPILAVCCGLCQCSSQFAAWHVGRTNEAAENRILLIQPHPPSMGYQRLLSQRQLHPEFAEWLDKMGMPEFMAEKTKDDFHYLVLYYASQRRAYCCRTANHYTSQPFEISGPWNISAHELRILQQFRNDSISPRPSVLEYP